MFDDSTSATIAPELIIVNERANNQRTVTDITRIVNSVVNRMQRQWGLSTAEADDLRQDGYLAAISADKSFDPHRGKWSSWLATRVRGQLKDSIVKLRNCGMTGTDVPIIYAEPLNGPMRYEENAVDDDPTVLAVDTESVESDGIPSPDALPEESAEIASSIERLDNCMSLRSLHVLRRYYGLDGQKTGSLVDLGRSLGYSKKHAFTLLQAALAEARICLEIAAGISLIR